MFSAASDHHFRVAVLNHARCQTDVVRARSTGRNHRDIWPAQAKHNRDMPRRHINNGAGHEKRRNALRPLLEIGFTGGFNAVDAADACTDCNANAVAIGVGNLNAAVFNRLSRRRNAVMNKRIHLAHIFRRNVARWIKIPNWTTKFDGKLGRLQVRNRPDPGFCRHHIRPSAGQIITHWRDDAHAGDYYASFAHDCAVLKCAFECAAKNYCR